MQASRWEGLIPAHWWVELGLFSVVSRALSSSVFRSSCGLRKTLSSLSADGWGCVPTLLVVWPAASQHWSLRALGWDQVFASKWWPPGQLTPMSTQQCLCHQCPCFCSEPEPPPASPGDLPRPAGRSGPGSCEVTAFSPGSRCAQDLVFTLQEWHFCSPQSCGVPTIKPCWPSKQML